MTRIRTLKPEWIEDEALMEAGPLARLLSVILILLADDHGRGRIAEKVLAAQFLPGEPEALIKLRETLARLAVTGDGTGDGGFIVLYRVRGQRYYFIRNWFKHQRIDRPSKARHPSPEEGEPDPPPHPGGGGQSDSETEASRQPRDGLAEDSRRTGIWTGTGTGSEDHSRDLASDPSEVGSRDHHQPPQQVGLATLGDQIRAGVVQAFTDLGEPPPKETRILTWPGWVEIARYVREKSALLGEDDELAIAAHLVRCWIRHRNMIDRGWPLGFLARNAREFWRDVLPAEVA